MSESTLTRKSRRSITAIAHHYEAYKGRLVVTVKFKVELWESERGWGQRLDEVREFDDAQKALDFYREFNTENDKDEVPAWYMFAKKPVMVEIKDN